MTDGLQFKAPWGTSLKAMTTLSVLLLTGVPLIGTFTGPRSDPMWILSMIVLPISILILAAFFAIRGFVLSEDTLCIRRLGWNSKLNLADLTSAKVDPDAMSRSVRTFGNGGLFCFAGWFRNRTLGSYRAFATDPRCAVVLRFKDRTVVVTPDNPKAFVAQINRLRSLVP
jgi:hypothetical protein